MKKIITEEDIKKILRNGGNEILIEKDAIVTPLALDRIQLSKIKIAFESKGQSTAASKNIKIVIGSDHTGVKAKKIVFDLLKSKNYDPIDVGAFTEDSVDYPDIAFNVANRVAIAEADYGIILDATGIPSAITANKIPGIRAATCYNEFSAKSSREHNNANVLVLGAKTLGDETIKSIVDVWLRSSFLGDRHQRRLDKIQLIEEKYSKK